MMNGVPWWFVDGAPLASVDPAGGSPPRCRSARYWAAWSTPPAAVEEPARIAVAMLDHLAVGEPGGGMSVRAQAVATILDQAGLAGRAIPDVRRAIWYKLWGNMTTNPISALTLATADRILANAEVSIVHARLHGRGGGDRRGDRMSRSPKAARSG